MFVETHFSTIRAKVAKAIAAVDREIQEEIEDAQEVAAYRRRPKEIRRAPN